LADNYSLFNFMAEICLTNPAVNCMLKTKKSF
jgi:hypothetical protein